MATVELTKENFEQTITGNDIVIIDFWAPWCGPCKEFGPIFEKVSDAYPDIVFGKVNTEEQQELAGYFQIQSIPTTVILREGIAIFKQPGLLPEEALTDVLKQAKELDMEMVKREIAKEQEKGKEA